MTERGGGGGLALHKCREGRQWQSWEWIKKCWDEEKKWGELTKKRIEVVGYPLDMHKQETEEAGGQEQQIKLYGLVRILQRDR